MNVDQLMRDADREELLGYAARAKELRERAAELGTD